MELSNPTFNSVLIANRGEIARRIMRTLRDMGLRSVAVFSDADEASPHVNEADEAVRLGPAPSAESYLNIEAVIEAARRTGAGAVHPGYGFLAENAKLAEACAANGLVFIGPSAEAIRRMGNKVAAKELAREIGLPVLEGFAAVGERPEIVARAEQLGYPLMIKAAAGGGGKGMRRVRRPSELEASLDAARREAKSAFGEGALLLERSLDTLRHVEIQIFGDCYGHCLHLYERDCSLQRRHQKVIEEAPSPVVDSALRQRMGEAAVALARAVDYEGAGTVEFLLDGDGSFYFLEMNTRLQVEHPVTEAITGLDLVRLQIEVAQGLPLAFKQHEVPFEGHAIEARLYAEDPARDFLPTSGQVSLWAAKEVPGTRIDSGVEAGSELSIHYEPMLAKVIAHGKDRREAMRRLDLALCELAVGGLVNNRDFLLAALRHPEFRAGTVDTAFLDRHQAKSMLLPEDPGALELHGLIATLWLVHQRRQGPQAVPSGIPAGWRNNRWRAHEQLFQHAGGVVEVFYVATGSQQLAMAVKQVPNSQMAADEEMPPANVGQQRLDRNVRLISSEAGRLSAEIDGIRRRFHVALGSGGGLTVYGLGRISELSPKPRFPARQAAMAAGGCIAPMTGKVLNVFVQEGQQVKIGEPLVLLEAMKMEHQLQAHTDGVVTAVRTAKGETVDPDDVLVVVAANEDADP